jgi:hypothetical protein
VQQGVDDGLQPCRSKKKYILQFWMLCKQLKAFSP